MNITRKLRLQRRNRRISWLVIKKNWIKFMREQRKLNLKNQLMLARQQMMMMKLKSLKAKLKY